MATAGAADAADAAYGVARAAEAAAESPLPEDAVERVLRHEYDDLWGALGLPHGAGSDEVLHAYRRTSVRVHPDKVPSARKEDAQRAMRVVNEARDVLQCERSRRRYLLSGDAVRRRGTWRRYQEALQADQAADAERDARREAKRQRQVWEAERARHEAAQAEQAARAAADARRTEAGEKRQREHEGEGRQEAQQQRSRDRKRRKQQAAAAARASAATTDEAAAAACSGRPTG